MSHAEVCHSVRAARSPHGVLRIGSRANHPEVHRSTPILARSRGACCCWLTSQCRWSSLCAHRSECIFSRISARWCAACSARLCRRNSWCNRLHGIDARSVHVGKNSQSSPEEMPHHRSLHFKIIGIFRLGLNDQWDPILNFNAKLNERFHFEWIVGH